MKAPARGRVRFLVYAGLTLLTIAVYAQVAGHDFINLDDREYIGLNSHIQDGLTLAGLKWAFTTFYCNNWHPLTWLSHMLDLQLFGLRPGGHHLVSLLFHLASTLLLCRFFAVTTGRLWPSAFVAALFAVHPLHVESVAWAAERKDVLSTFFFFLALNLYGSYARTLSWRHYLLTLAVFALGLLAKPMLVSMPVLLLLMDHWPLGRFAGSPANRNLPAVSLRRPLCEKLPFVVLAFISCMVTLQAQSNAMTLLAELSPVMRLANATLAYAKYLGKMLLPTDLAVFYPLAVPVPAFSAIAALLLLAVTTLLVFWKMRTFPYLVVGWLWYLVTLLPVIGIVHVGWQEMADRYTYIPLTGIFVMVAFGGSDAAGRWKLPPWLLRCTAGIILVALSLQCMRQVGLWRDDVTLFSHALAVTDKNWMAHSNLAAGLIRKGHLAEADRNLVLALGYRPEYEPAIAGRGFIATLQGRHREALGFYVKAATLLPDDPRLYEAVFGEFLALGHRDGAEAALHRLRLLDPDRAELLARRLPEAASSKP